MKKLQKNTLKIIAILIISMFIIGYTRGIFASTSNQIVIVINPGHGGGYTGGANNSKGLVEKDLTLKIGNYLKEYLLQYRDVKIIMTHDGKTFPNNDAGDLNARCMVARNNNANLYVSLHIDDANDKTLNGATVYCTYRNDLDKYYKGMNKLGNLILSNINKLGISSNGVKTQKCSDNEPKYQYITTHTDSNGNIVHDQADYYNDIRACMKGDSEGYGEDFTNGSGVPAVLIEHCYINNSHDVNYIDSENDLKNLAEADGKAIVDYFNLKLKSASSDLPFFDVSDTDWFHNAVKYVYENNIIKGYNEAEFGPKDNLTRGQLVTILYRMESSPKVSKKSNFPDVQDSNKYYYNAVNWASENNIVSGYLNGNFGPGDNITREQLAVILYKCAKYNGKDVSKTNNLAEFTDTNKIADYAKTQVKWAVDSGVITGNINKTTGEKTINPKGNATRAEVAAMMEKYCKNIGR